MVIKIINLNEQDLGIREIIINQDRLKSIAESFNDKQVLIVGDVMIYNDADTDRTTPVAQSQMTYSLPPMRGRS